MTEAATWAWVAGELAAGPVALAALVGESGSSPGRIGATMALSPHHGPVGTVGGGPAESLLIQRCRDLLAHAGPPQLLDLTHRPGATNPSGLGCGGAATYAAWLLHPPERAAVVALATALAVGENRIWQLDGQGWHCAATRVPTGLRRDRDQWSLAVEAGPRSRVLIAGGGHVSLALTQVLTSCDFAVLVVDERPELPTLAANTAAQQRITCRYEELPEVVAAHGVNMAVVATHEPSADARAMAALLPLPLDYLGLLGSRAKVARLLGPSHPAHVRAPAGLAIGSQTPAEIAVSIAAEMVAVRAQRAAAAR